ncbi:tRNA-specific adenosine deaminase [tadA] [Acididesulfobacillus acetoxydans]|uniref:tRNA-specific adenosine deaminase n=1 Tax=Acididesulfobacillus acetoxydans TaxID=1561005 RepID=A0A8S0X377_9FIRM|nr:tRNA adenosine(34) deaminase TadA [Acididesulfobacillus acetoxydans]CAA7599850.1 tRNA-specific adenosine deaminase [tadA] [Acididesulfobacillus acetoxydans]CEJ07416.1 tRNA-specific adenosine deaminase [Acididesulfobacillus acetoxydans]
MRHEDWMRLALAEAKLAAAEGEVPIGALIVSENKVLARVHNKKEQAQDPTAHAEILAIRGASAVLGTWRLERATLYVTLEPCAMCAGAIIQARLARLIFGAPDGKGGAAGSVMNVLDVNRWNHRVEVLGGILEAECGEVLKDFFRRKR